MHASRPAPLAAPVRRAALPGAAASPVLLLVEDDAINRMVAQTLLESLGYPEVQLAADGREALALCAARQPDLVLMDCLMPIMGGLEATRRLRAGGFHRPVIALTGSTAPHEVERCRDAGMDDHLGKPIDVRRLDAVLARWLAQPAALRAIN